MNKNSGRPGRRCIFWCFILWMIMCGGVLAQDEAGIEVENAIDVEEEDGVGETPSVDPGKTGDPEKIIEEFFAIYETGDYTQYGYKLFDHPETAPPYTPGPDYILGPEDELMVKVWGESLLQFNMISRNETSDYLEQTLTVDSDGCVTFPEIGVLSVGGVSLDKAERLVTKKYQTIYKDCSVILSLTKARSLSLLVVGHVFNPGPVELMAGSTLYDALIASGGVSKRGTLRNIVLKHLDGTTESFDFYELLVSGKIDSIPRIRNQDAIHVGGIGPVVLAAGRIRHPAIYEILEKDRLSDVIRYAGGLFPDTARRSILVKRFESDGRKIISVAESDAAISFQDGDVIHFTRQDAEITNAVALTGHVRVEKTVGWREGLRLSHLLENHAQLKKRAALEYAEITRFQEPDLRKTIVTFHPGNLLDGDAREDLLLRPYDKIRIFNRAEIQRRPMVKISGLVRKPGAYRWLEQLKLTTLIGKAGGPLPGAADPVRIFRYRYENGAWNTSTLVASLESARTDSEKDVLLEPLDRVMVHQQKDFDQTAWEATLGGEVKFPGAHPIGKSTRLADAVKQAGGLTPDAWLPGLRLHREAAENVQVRYQEAFIDLLKKDLALQSAQMAGPYLNEEERLERKQSMTLLQDYLTHLESRAPGGRIVLDPASLASLDALEKSASNLPLENGDRIFIPGKPRFISIVGEVFRPSSYLHVEGKKVGDYLAMAGGHTSTADMASAFLVRAGGLIVSYRQKKEQFTDVVMEPGDVLALPARIGER